MHASFPPVGSYMSLQHDWPGFSQTAASLGIQPADSENTPIRSTSVRRDTSHRDHERLEQTSENLGIPRYKENYSVSHHSS